MQSDWLSCFRVCATGIASILLLIIQCDPCDSGEKELWVYCPANFLVDAECQRVHQVMEQAARFGYTHVLVSDSKFSRLKEMGKRYFQHIDDLKAKAAALQLVLVPACCPVGYSNDILALDPNLAEALPVRHLPYRVEGDQAVHQPDPNVTLPNLSDRKRWGFMDECFASSDEGGVVAAAPFTSNARVMKKIPTTRFQQYHASVWIKTKDFPTQVEIKVLDSNGHNLNYTYLNNKPTQAWTQHHVTFNSLGNTELNFYVGAWGPKSGQLWLRDPMLESTGAVNLVRRNTAPVQVQLVKGSELVDLKENEDFEAWRDSKLGTVPYPGEYEAWHQPPPIRLKRKLPEGSKLQVSYFHTHIIHEGQVCGSIGDAAFEKLLEQQVASIHQIMPAASFMMSHDEIRVMGWTEPSAAGVRKGASPGELLTHNVNFCYQSILRSNPQARVLTWSDMFDPFHNAVDNYYLVNGSLKSASLPKPVWVMNWNSDKQSESLRYFDKLGHQQVIAGYYDQPPQEIDNWLDVVMKNQVKGVEGVMYTTWRQDYSQLEAFAKQVKQHGWYTSTR